MIHHDVTGERAAAGRERAAGPLELTWATYKRLPFLTLARTERAGRPER
jgi:hypothetical protein